jgi:DNA polymerase zeta
MLSEILKTRIMVKQAMKNAKNNKSLYRALDSRQLGNFNNCLRQVLNCVGLKLLANVTYGYTGANFSGRMPCVELADAIVQTARVTLENSIKLINSHTHWGAEVVYGDTDSMFVLVRGASTEKAFALGQVVLVWIYYFVVISKEIADHITSSNPDPVKLQMEKVFHPCVLISKKRYVGLKYESLGDIETGGITG